MLSSPSLLTRVVVGSTVGFVFGVTGAVSLTLSFPAGGWQVPIGIGFWYTTLGAIIGVFGVITQHPTLRLPIAWWLRAPTIGAWMNLMLVLIAHREVAEIATHGFGFSNGWSSPYWFVLEGAVAGLVIGYFTTQLGGEGKHLLDENDGPRTTSHL